MGYDESSYETLGLAGAIVAGEATEEEIARFREPPAGSGAQGVVAQEGGAGAAGG